jgi:glutamate--glyoxylate aminotransferase
MAPSLLEDPRVNALFPSDVVARAQEYIKNVKGGLGAYTDSRGSLYIRQEIANFITRRDGVPASADKIFVSNGASECVRMFLNCVIRGPKDGVMVPIPQYPLYSASIALYGGSLVGYYLNEETTWSLDVNEMQRALNDARSKGITVRAMVFINPGNPTGQCLSEGNIQDLIRFCCDNRIVLCADEVYQANIYTEKTFTSARCVLSKMQEPYK